MIVGGGIAGCSVAYHLAKLGRGDVLLLLLQQGKFTGGTTWHAAGLVGQMRPLYVPVEMTRHVYLALKDAGQYLGLRDAGYYALDALRIEQGRRAWGAELGPDETPWEAGLAFRVRLDKPADFIGKSALLAARGLPLRKKLVTLVFDSPAAFAWGGETIVRGGAPIGEITSAGWSPLAGACVALGSLRGAAVRWPTRRCAACSTAPSTARR